MLKRLFLLVTAFSGICLEGLAQFPPPAGQPGTTAIYQDSSIFKSWAITCHVTRGFVDISDTTITYPVVGGLNHASYGQDSDGTGIPDDFVVSLGDGGSAVVTFETSIGNGPGPDFAVFENSLSDDFLELAFVEVSSDGIRYVRFPSTSLTQDTLQTPGFGTTDATKIHNLAGKYRATYGTPFDLEDLKDSSGINIQAISSVRIVDVVGCIQAPWATRDGFGHIVNDPWPTPFNTCGFDLDAVGLINEGAQAVTPVPDPRAPLVFPNPAPDKVTIRLGEKIPVRFRLENMVGKSLMETIFTGTLKVDLISLPQGIYLGVVTYPDGSVRTCKILKN